MPVLAELIAEPRAIVSGYQAILVALKDSVDLIAAYRLASSTSAFAIIGQLLRAPYH